MCRSVTVKSNGYSSAKWQHSSVPNKRRRDKVLGSVGGLLYRMEPLLCIGEELPLLFEDLGTNAFTS